MKENEDMTYEMEQDDAIMPYGWAEGDDYFDSDSWTGSGEEASAASDTDAQSETDETAMEQSDVEDAPATEQPAEDEVEESAEESAAEKSTAAPTKHKVKYQFDHKDVEEEIDEADLPEIMQKARSAERHKARATALQENQQKAETVAKVLGYKGSEELMNAVLENVRNSERAALLAKGNSEEIVDDYLARKYAMVSGKAPTAGESTPSAAPETKPQMMPFADQAKELLNEFPTLRGTRLPDDVLAASASGKKTLLQAYREHKDKLETAETNRLRKENQILKQNAASAKRAPVSGVSKGGKTDTKPEDDFLRGFNADY